MSRYEVRHGMSFSPEYAAWLNMRARCRLKCMNRFHRYGGRGIKVCERWSVFENFFADMGYRPSIEHSLDRINNDGNYEPGNCRWATRDEQNANKSCNRLICHSGQTRTLSEWAKYAGLPMVAFAYRLRRGWTMARALTEPLHKKRMERVKP